MSTTDQTAAPAEDTGADTGDATDTTAEAPAFDIADFAAAEFEHEEMNGEHRGLPGYQKILDQMTPDGRRTVQNLRSSYSRKTAELSELRRDLEAQRAELVRQRGILADSPATTAIAEKASADPTAAEGFDPWSEEGLSALIEQRAAQMMQQMLAPMQADLAGQRRRAELDTFKTDHPDMTADPDIKSRIVDMLKSNPDMKLETAYWAARGRVHANREQTAREQSNAQRAAARQTLSATSTGKAINGTTRAPKFRNAWQAYQWHQQQSKG